MRLRRKEEPHGNRTLHMSDAAFADYLEDRPDVRILQELPIKRFDGVSPELDELRTNKWGAIPTQVDGYQFASKMEANRFIVLRDWQKKGRIHSLSTQHDNRKQHTWVLFEGKKVRGKKQRDIRYVDDFQYIQTDTGYLVVEDIKGAEPATFKVKAKMFRQVFPGVHFFINHNIQGWYTPEEKYAYNTFDYVDR